MTRYWKTAVGVAALVVGLAACGWGQTFPAVHVTDETAELTGVVRNSVAGPTTWWFEYGKTTGYGSSTPHRTVDLTTANQGYTATERVVGLEGGTTYHSKLCAADVDGHGVCGGDQPFTTGTAQDWVSGHGYILKNVVMGMSLGGGAFATSNADGSNAAGDAGSEDLSSRFGEAGPVTCLRVAGNRATIGFLASPPEGTGLPPGPPIPRLIFMEDNGSTGDRYGVRNVADATVCPAPTAADFPNFVFGPQSIPPVISEGDFSVHDHAAP